MPTLRDKKSGQTYDVSDVDAIDSVRQNPNLEIVGDVNVTSGRGASSVPTSFLDTHGGLSAANQRDLEQAAHEQRQTVAHDTFGSKAKAFLGGAASTLDAGLWKPWSEDVNYHPGYATAGSIGALIPALFTGEGEAAAAGDVAREGLAAERTAAGAVELGEEAGGLGKSALNAYSYTPPGIAARIGRAASSVVPEAVGGSKAVGNIARTAVEGAAWSSSDELIHQALDSDAEFSGEHLLSAAAYGGLIGGAGSAVAEGMGAGSKLLRGAGKETEALDEPAMRAKHPADTIGYSEPQTFFDLTKSPDGLKAADAIAAHQKDVTRLIDTSQELLKDPELLKAKGIVPGELSPLISDASKSVKGLEALKSGMAQPRSLTRYLNAADELGQRLAPVTDSVPSRFVDPDVRQQFWKRVGQISEDASPEQQAAERVWAHLASDMAPADAASARQGLLASAGKALLGKGLIGKIAQGGTMGATAAIVGEHIVEHGMHGLVHGALGLSTAGAGAAVGAKLIRAAFKDPAIGGAIAGSTAHVLRSANVLPDDHVASTTDPRRALRDLADRTRRITPQAASGHAVAALQHVAGQAPIAVVKAGEVAARRQQFLLSLLDHEDPEPTLAGRLLGRPLPSAASAGRVADSIRALASPANVVLAAMDGRLTPSMVLAAEAVYPATVKRLRATLLSQLATVKDPLRIPAPRRRVIEALLGRQALGGPGPSAAYRGAMRQSEMRAVQMVPGPQAKPAAAPSGPIGRSPLATPSQRAAHPGDDR